MSLKRRGSSARIDAGGSAICLSSNRRDRWNEQQTGGRARLEALRREWLKTNGRQDIAVKIQERVIIAPALFMWNLEKT